MRTIPANLATHLAGNVTSLAVCWRITRRDGVVLRGTQHDRALTITSGSYAGTYPATSAISATSIRGNHDLAVDNLEVEGPLDDGLTVEGLDVNALEAGLYDGAAVVLFVCNWQAPDDGQVELRAGTLGEARYTAEGRYTAELRGLAQALSQSVLRTYGVLCDAELGDARCTVNVAALTVTGEVASVTSRRLFVGTAPGANATAGYYIGGVVTFTSGENAGFSREIRGDRNGATLELDLFEPLFYEPEVGDEFTLAPGCRKTKAACQAFGNFVNFRGHGLYVPGQTAVLTIGGQ